LVPTSLWISSGSLVFAGWSERNNGQVIRYRLLLFVGIGFMAISETGLSEDKSFSLSGSDAVSNI
jgi:hypothetical protein